jgi:hypothetical protein
MSAAVPESVTIPAVPGQVREACAFVFPVKKKMGHFVARCPG